MWTIAKKRVKIRFRVKGVLKDMVGLLSDVGNTRVLNEDSLGYYEDELKRIYVVADGMGGYSAGEVASKLAVDTILANLKSITDLQDLHSSINNAVIAANKEIYNLSNENSKLSGMGTTITACLIVNKRLFVANVGDSSCYFVKNDSINKITKDHSLVQQLIDNGSITEEEAVTHPNKNIITRALGTNPVVEVDIFEHDLCDVSKILLCTDGLTNYIRPKELLDIVLENESQVACEKLIELSKLRGGRDNISVIVIEGECKNDRNLAR